MQSTDENFFFNSFNNGATYIPITKTWPMDLETPLSTWLKLEKENNLGVLLESVEGGENLGRWSVVASDPLWVVSAKEKTLKRQWRNGKVDYQIGNPFAVLKDFNKVSIFSCSLVKLILATSKSLSDSFSVS